MLPAHAGVVLGPAPRPAHRRGAPRARGGGPTKWPLAHHRPWCSLRTRGWSLTRVAEVLERPMLPAHAGVVPLIRERPDAMHHAPCSGGDGPSAGSTHALQVGRAPRVRGDGPVVRCRWKENVTEPSGYGASRTGLSIRSPRFRRRPRSFPSSGDHIGMAVPYACGRTARPLGYRSAGRAGLAGLGLVALMPLTILFRWPLRAGLAMTVTAIPGRSIQPR
ncbi:hypothetical protein SAMN05421505_110135 [Sinosporangium album]|uniref:Uncharacterized protein n=1 Tax=Sinosporangium album TaxID=504805 RepID=A0A1G7Z0M6_9ACTN|nr:hypothetical protein SAMN05421505_110135 [Sinosporangium album]